MSEKRFAHLHCHSHYSLLDGASPIPKLIQSGKADKVFQGYLLSTLCGLAMVALVAILVESARKWIGPRQPELAPAE